MSLPPEILLRTFGTETSEHTLDGDVDTQLRICICRPIFRGIAPSVDDLSQHLREKIEHFVMLFKKIIRPILIGGKVFHHTPFLPLAEKTPWCVLEYARSDRSAGIAAVFRTADAGTSEYVFKARGLDPSKSYKVILDNSGLGWTDSGKELIRSGIPIRLEEPQTSELLLFQEITNK